MPIWSFWDFVSIRGVNEIHRWLHSDAVPAKARAKINARIISLQGFALFPDQYFSALKGWDDLYEMRVGFSGVEYRPIGCYGPMGRQFTFLIGAIEKGEIPRRLLETADDRRKLIHADPKRIERHNFQ